MREFKAVAVGVLAVLLAIIAFQNTEQVQTNLLFTSVTMPRAILLFATTTIGFVAGAIVYPRIRMAVRN